MSPVEVAKEWWFGTPLKRYTLVIGAITATFSAILAAMHVGEVAKPYWFVQRYEFEAAFERSELVNAKQFLELQIATKEGARSNIQAQLDRLEYELRKNTDAPDSLKQIIAEQIRRYTDQLRMLNNELDDLYRARANRRP